MSAVLPTASLLPSQDGGWELPVFVMASYPLHTGMEQELKSLSVGIVLKRLFVSLGNICEKIELLSTFLSLSKSGTYLGKKGFPSYMFTEKNQNKKQKKTQIEYTSLNYI